MAISLSKPKKPQFINAGAKSLGAIAGYQGYDMIAQKIPVSKEMNLGILGGSLLAQSMMKGEGTMFAIASALMLGVTVSAGQMALEDYNIIKVGGVVKAPVEVEEIETEAEALKSLFTDQVEYIEDAVIVNAPEEVDLS